MKLPETFVCSMRELLGPEELEAFLASYDAPRTWGLRVNTLKLSVEDYLQRPSCLLRLQGDEKSETTSGEDSLEQMNGDGASDPFGGNGSLEPDKNGKAHSHRVGWSRDGFRHDGSRSSGRTADYHAGLYYSQDPSAMLPAELLAPVPGERVLDLCAAPGGKSVQMAAMMRNKGFLLTNDISPKRVKPLRRNLEGLGVACAVVANEEPARLAKTFPLFFDAVLLDVPCSGEGMFRKDETAVRSWKRHDADALEAVQRDLLETAWQMLRPGGRLVYSTCTFNTRENEENVAWALSRFPDMEVDPAQDWPDGLAHGNTAHTPAFPELDGAVRVWPHRTDGEGQFAVLLRKRAVETDGIPLVNDVVKPPAMTPAKPAAQLAADPSSTISLKCEPHGMDRRRDRQRGKKEQVSAMHVPTGGVREAAEDALLAWQSFFAEEMTPDTRLIGSNLPLWQTAGNTGALLQAGTLGDALTEGTCPALLQAGTPVNARMEGIPSALLQSGTGLFHAGYAAFCPPAILMALRLEMPGLYVGEFDNNRFEPSSALLHALTPDAARRRVDYPADSEEVRRYLHGETLMRDGERGWTAVLADGFPLGWAKQEEGTLKNRYPKGWRMQ